MPFRKTDKERFDEKFIWTPSCWLWKAGTTDKGYGQFYIGGVAIKAHRASYMFYVEDFDKKLIVRHRCDNPICVNPLHLVLGTQKDNIQDAIERKRFPRGERHGCSKLSREDVKEVRNLRKTTTMTDHQIARKFGVTRSAVSKIFLGLNWKDI